MGDRYGYGISRGSTVRSGSLPGRPPILSSFVGDADVPETAGLADDAAPDAASPDGPGSGSERATATTTTVVSTPAANARPSDPNRCQREPMTGIQAMLVSPERST